MWGRASGTYGFRSRGNIPAKTFYQAAPQSIVWLQENMPKLLPQLCDCTVLAGFSTIFEMFVLVNGSKICSSASPAHAVARPARYTVA